MLISLQNFKVFYIFVFYCQVVLSNLGNYFVELAFLGPYIDVLSSLNHNQVGPI